MRPGIRRCRYSGAVRLEQVLIPTAVLLVAFAAVVIAGMLSRWTVDAAPYSSRGDPLIQAAQLTPSDGGQIGFGSAAISGPILAGGAPQLTVGANQNQGEVYLFTKPAGGWANETQAAKLVASDGTAGENFGSSLAISGDTIVVGTGSASGEYRSGTALYVFTKPPGGWSGTLYESAKLTVAGPDAAGLGPVAISGDTIVAGAPSTQVGSNRRQGAVYLFNKPAAGWTGTIHESAKLTASSGVAEEALGVAVAVSRGAVFAGAFTNASLETVYVFKQPNGGWSGTVHERAMLVAPSSKALSSMAASGTTVVAGSDGSDPVAFTEPPQGWSGTIHPAARLTMNFGDRDLGPFVAVSGNTVVALKAMTGPMACCSYVPLPGSLYTFNQPPGGWSGVIGAESNAATTVSSTGIPLAMDGNTIATGGYGALDVLTVEPGPPRASNASLSGLATGKPKLRFRLYSDRGAPSIKALKLMLPAGLRFTRPRTGRDRSILINGTPASAVRLSGGALSVTPHHPASSLSVAIAHPTLTEAPTLISRVQRLRRYNRTHRRKRALTVRIAAEVTDTSGHLTLLTVKVPSS